MNSALRFSFALLALPAATFGRPPAPAPAAEAKVPDVPDQLDLRTAIAYALENNFDIRQARERIKEQEGLIVEVRARALPNVSAVADYTTNDKEIGQGRPPQEQDWTIALQVRQALYAGGGIKSALDAQKIVREAALLELRSVINGALLDVRTRFYDVLLAREQIKVQEQNVKLFEEQLQNAKNRFEAGSVSNFEVLRAEVELANAKPRLIRARNDFRVAIDRLRLAIGYSNLSKENTARVPEFVGALEFSPVSYDLQTALDSARANRPELLRYGKLEQAQERAVDNARSGYRPTLDLVGSYGLYKDGESNAFRDSNDGWRVGVQGNWAIFDGRATAGRVAQAKSRVRQAQTLLSQQTLAVEVEVRSALSTLQEAGELAEAASKVVGQAEEALRLANARYSAGSATQLDVLTAQVSLTQARDNQLQANYSHSVAVANVRRALGEPDAYAPEAETP